MWKTYDHICDRSVTWRSNAWCSSLRSSHVMCSNLWVFWCKVRITADYEDHRGVLVDTDMIPGFPTFPHEPSPRLPHRHPIATSLSHRIAPRPSPFHR